MGEAVGGSTAPAQTRARLERQLDQALERLGRTHAFAKVARRAPVLDLARRILALPEGAALLGSKAVAMDAAGLFTGTDWERPEVLQPSLTANTLRFSDAATATLEALSELRLLAIARGEYAHPGFSSEQARHYLAQVLALNLDLLFGAHGEAERARQGGPGPALGPLMEHLADHVGFEQVLDQVIDEIWRILAQRPIRLDGVKVMITRIAACLHDPEVETGGAGRGADRVISALYGPTNGCREDPGLDAYAQRLAQMDVATLAQEAAGFARAMHDTGIVSPYHTVFLRSVRGYHDDLIPVALGLSSTGRDALLCYQELAHRLVDEAVHPETSQAVYGLALLLERGILYMPPVAPALWRQVALVPSDTARASLAAAFGTARPPETFLLAGVLSVLGQPLGVGQGNNPTCQAARALSMWSYADPSYLLQMVAWAARDDEVVIPFEGVPLSSRSLQQGLVQRPPLDVDAVSVVLVPHLDRIYMEMGRLCADRGDDPHRWINPEFHGWWVGRGTRLAIDVPTGSLADYAGFVRHFYATYHPYYNGHQPVIHPQPAGVAVTDSTGRFVGWHAITLLRVSLDHEGGMRAYFYNPNNDSGQDWGQAVVVSTEGRGERFGESSLPFEEFASRLYLFHFDPLERGRPEAVPADEIERVMARGRASWAATR
jgi:hypothetical protein